MQALFSTELGRPALCPLLYGSLSGSPTHGTLEAHAWFAQGAWGGGEAGGGGAGGSAGGEGGGGIGGIDGGVGGGGGRDGGDLGGGSSQPLAMESMARWTISRPIGRVRISYGTFVSVTDGN